MGLAARLERWNARVDARWDRLTEGVGRADPPTGGLAARLGARLWLGLGRVRARADRAPVTALAVSGALFAACVAVPAMGIGKLLGGPEKAGDGIDGGELFGVGVCLLVVLLLGVAVWWLPRTWCGVGRRRSAGIMAAATAAGLLPWLSWHGPSVFGDAFGPVHEGFRAALFFLAGVLVLPAVTLLLVGGRPARVAGAVLLVLAAGLWWPARQGLLAASAADTLRDLGGPPRAQVQAVRWSGAAPVGTDYRDGVLVTEYGQMFWYGGLAVVPIRNTGTGTGPGSGAALDTDLCAAAQRALRVADPAVFGQAEPADTACGPYGAGLWQLGPYALARRSGPWAVVAADEPDEPADLTDLAAALSSAHPADDAQLPLLDTGPITP